MHARSTLVVAVLVCCVPLPGQTCGDCDSSGDINVVDSLRIAQMAAGILAPQLGDLCVCDVNGSGVIEVTDALLVAQVAAGLAVSLGCPPCSSLPPSCTIGLPLPSSPPQSSPVKIDFYPRDMDSPTVTVTSEFSTDGGITYLLATVDPTGMAPYTVNPTPSVVPVGSHDFIWDSVTDAGCASMVDWRVTIDDGTSQAECFTSFPIPSACLPPSCLIVAPLFASPPGSGDIVIDFDTADADSPTIEVTFEWSPWSPISYAPATVAASSPSPYTVNPTPGVPPAGGQRFVWDSAADFPSRGFVRFRITVSDGFYQLDCNSSFELAN